jgi:hypothetical protein
VPLFKFRVSWEDDVNIQRDIEILSTHTFENFHHIIKAAFLMKIEWQAEFAIINVMGKREWLIDTTVEKNIKGAPALSARKIPIGSMVSHPSQEFVYSLTTEKDWSFLIDFITMDAEPGDPSLYPRVTRIDGISPMELSSKGGSTNKMVDTEEKYDSGKGDDDEGLNDGFGIEGDDDGDADNDEYGDDDGGGQDANDAEMY